MIREGTISGIKFNDRDRDGSRDDTEEGLEAWTIYLDDNGNGRLDDNEPRVSTDTQGAFKFIDVPGGVHRVAEVAQDQWLATAPVGGVQEVNLSRGQNLSGVNFASHTKARDTIAAPAGDAFGVNTTTSASNLPPAIASSASGDFIVVWPSVDAGTDGWDIRGQRYDKHGRRAGVEFIVNSNTAGDQSSPVIAIDTEGNFTVAWQSMPPQGNSGIYARRFDRQGRPRGVDFAVSTPGYRAAPQIAMDRRGDFVVTWEGFGTDFVTDVYAQRFDALGRRQGGEFRVSSDTGSSRYDVSVAMDDDGDFVVTWTSIDANYQGEIHARRYAAAGAAVGQELLVAPGFASSVAMDSDGDFVIAYVGQWPDPGLRFQRFNQSGVRQGGPLIVPTISSFFQSTAVAMDDDGDFVVQYQSLVPDGNNDTGGIGDVAGAASYCGVTGGYGYYNSYGTFSICARRYNVAGVPQGDEIVVAQPGDSAGQAVAMDADGDFVVVWSTGYYYVATPSISARRYTVTQEVNPIAGAHSTAATLGLSRRDEEHWL
jgi:hypothetical protein